MMSLAIIQSSSSLYSSKMCTGTVCGEWIIGMALSIRLMWYFSPRKLVYLVKAVAVFFSQAFFCQLSILGGSLVISWILTVTRPCSWACLQVIIDGCLGASMIVNVVEIDLLLCEFLTHVVPTLVIGCPSHPLRIVLQGFISSKRPNVCRSLTVKIHVSAPVPIFVLMVCLSVTLTGV